MKNNLFVILLLAGLLIPAKQTVAQLLPKRSITKEQQKPIFRNSPAKTVKLKKEHTLASTNTKPKHKANNMTYEPIASLPYTNSSSLDENSYEVTFQYPFYAEGYALTLNKGEMVQILHQSTDFDCYLYLLDSNYNIVSENDDYDYNSGYDSRITFSAFYTGTYYILAAGYDDWEIGDYTISVDYYPNPLSSQAYYVDALNGNDANGGQSPIDAMQTIQAVLAITNNATIYIMSDISLDATILIENASTICLAAYNNGTYTIKRTNNCVSSPMIEISGSILYIGNDAIVGELIIDGGYDAMDVSPIITDMPILMSDAESMVFLYSSTIQNNYSDNPTPIIYNEGTIYMYGGNVSDNKGTIYNYDGNFILFDGNITNNEQESNSGVYNWGCFVMYGGNISNNIANNYNSGLTNLGFFLMYGGTISENEADIISGVNSDGYFLMTAGSVRDNQAYQASGITNYYGVTKISGGSITGNVATMMSSGIINEEDGTLILSGGNVSGNVAMEYPNHGITHIGISCTISDSFSVSGEDQIYLLEGATITVNGTSTYRTVGTIMPFKFDNYNNPDYAHRAGLQILSGTPTGIREDCGKFRITNDGNNREWYLDSLGKLASDDVSIADYSNENIFDIYPNPATDLLYVNIDNAEVGQMSLQVYDVSGRILLQISNPVQFIDISELAIGIYFVKVKTQAGESVKKVVKH